MPPSAFTSLKLSDLPQWEQARIRSGMRSPRVVTLTAGERIYRFASSWDRYRRKPVPPSAWATGPWWIREDDYLKIEDAWNRSLRVHGGDRSKALTLGFLARQATAVMQSWSNVDRLVIADVIADFEVFTGLGRTQYNEIPPPGAVSYNLKLTWQGWDDVEQLYLPYLDRDREGHLRDGRHVLNIRKPVRVIDSQQLWT
jgi:hypothetical protein